MAVTPAGGLRDNRVQSLQYGPSTAVSTACPGPMVLALAGLCLLLGTLSLPTRLRSPFFGACPCPRHPARSRQPGLLTCQAWRSTRCNAILLIRAESSFRDSRLAGWHQKPRRREALALSRRKLVVWGGDGGGRGSPDCSMQGGGQTPNTEGTRHRKFGRQGN